MKLSSSTLCGCCFCCYCHSWLMMLLMVSSVVHVSPEMSTTTNKKYIKLNNNRYYQSEMTEFVQLNRKIPNRTSKTITVTTSPSTTTSTSATEMLSSLSSLSPSSPSSLPSGNNNYKGNEVNIYPTLEQDLIINTIATIQTQSTITSAATRRRTGTERLTTVTTPIATTKTTPAAVTTSFSPEQIQMTKKLNLYDTTATTTSTATSSLPSTSTTTLGNDAGQADEGVLNLYDNSIPEAATTSTATTAIADTTVYTTTDNYVADKNIIVQQQHQQLREPHVRIESTTKPLEIVVQKRTDAERKTIQITKQDYSSNSNNTTKNKQQHYNKDIRNSNRRPNAKRIENWNTTNSRQQQQHDASTSESFKVISSSINTHKTTTSPYNQKNKSNIRSKSSRNNSIYGTINSSVSNHLINMKIQKSQPTTFETKEPTSLRISTNSNSNNKQKTTIISLKNRTRTSDSSSSNNISSSRSSSSNITTTSNSSRSSSSSSYSQIPTDNTLEISNTSNKYSSNMNSKNLKTRPSTPSTLSTSSSNYSNNNKEINKFIDSTHHYLPKPVMSTTAAATTSTIEPTIRALQTTPVTTTFSTYISSMMLLQHNNQLKRPALLHRNTRQTADAEPNDKCPKFTEGDPEKNELYSPDYPNDYPKNINCTRIITAPKGQIIRLDFRNSFHIEAKEECKFDFLEIRDGQYGFSNIIGKFCGTNFPPEITSKERYLWLHFHSDESIEYSGFTAVYEFIDRNRDAPSTDLNCTIEKDGYEGFINATDVPTEIRDTVIRNKIPLDCMWRIQVQEKWKIQVKFVNFNLAKPNDCETNFLDIFPEQTVMPLRVKNFCGSAGEGITSDSNILHMRFYAEQVAINSSFSILYTAFRDRGSSSCAEEEYDCEDATCIEGGLKCNGRDNCKFRWDEESCPGPTEGQSEHMIIIITVFGLILGGMVITFLVNCVRKIMHDQKIIREHIRQSKESKLDEMGRNSKARSRDNISIVSPRQKHSQTSLQILDDVSNRYYREMELQSKGNFKEKDPSILRHHDMIVQTSLCSTDDSSTTITEQQTPSGGIGACDMGCQTRESLFATASLMRQKSKTPSMAGSQRTIEGVPPPPRFSTFGYDAAQIVPPPPPTVSTLSRRNMHLPQESLEMEQLPQQTAHMMMPHQQQQQQQHQHLHHRPSQEICHHHHQHQQHLQQQQQQQQQQLQQQQKQTLPRHQQQHQQPHHHQHLQQQQQQQQQHHHHTASTTIPPNVTHLSSAPGTTIVTAISTGTSGRQRGEQPGGGGVGGGGGKNKQTKLDESKVFIDIRNSAPDVIIMTSH